MPETRKRRGISLRIHIFIFAVLMSVVPMVLTGIALMQTAVSKEIDSSMKEMQGQVLILANQLSASDYLADPSGSAMEPVVEQIADIWGGRIQVMNSHCYILTDTYRVDQDRYNISEIAIQCLSSGQAQSYYDSSSGIVALVQPISGARQEEKTAGEETEETAAVPAVLDDDARVESDVAVDGIILVTVDMAPKTAAIKTVSDQSVMLWLAVSCVILFIVILWTWRMTLPFKRLVSSVEKAAIDNGIKVNVRTYTETSDISDTVNRTVERIRNLDQSRQEFVSNVSHELKTPITSIRVLADSLMAMENVPAELYREFMTDISAEIDRESQIIEDLLSMVRLDQSRQPLNIAQVNLNDWMESTLKRLRPIAQAKNIEVLLESFRPVTADIDEVKLTLAISNIIDNAIKYNHESGWIKVTLNADYQYFYIKITDSGIGIPEEALSHVFERFYRVDKARSRDSGGTGLGLAITNSIIQLHNGAIRVYSKPDEGSTFVIRIPLIYRNEQSGDEGGAS